jgi:hypothetical protein
MLLKLKRPNQKYEKYDKISDWLEYEKICCSEVKNCLMVVYGFLCLMSLNNISVISWWSVLLVEETGEEHRPVVSH